MSEIDIAQLNRDILKAGKRLDALAVKVQKQILRKASRASGAPFVKGLRVNAPKDDKDLSRTMGLQVVTDTAKGQVIMVAGQSLSKRKRRKAVQIHLADQPTKPHSITGQFTGSDGEAKVGTFQHPGTPGDEFVERTATSKQAEALKVFSAKLSSEIDAAVGSMS